MTLPICLRIKGRPSSRTAFAKQSCMTEPAGCNGRGRCTLENVLLGAPLGCVRVLRACRTKVVSMRRTASRGNRRRTPFRSAASRMRLPAVPAVRPMRQTTVPHRTVRYPPPPSANLHTLYRGFSDRICLSGTAPTGRIRHEQPADSHNRKSRNFPPRCAAYRRKRLEQGCTAGMPRCLHRHG